MAGNTRTFNLASPPGQHSQLLRPSLGVARAKEVAVTVCYLAEQQQRGSGKCLLSARATATRLRVVSLIYQSNSNEVAGDASYLPEQQQRDVGGCPLSGKT